MGFFFIYIINYDNEYKKRGNRIINNCTYATIFSTLCNFALFLNNTCACGGAT